MYLLKHSIWVFTLALIALASVALAQDEVIAQAYATVNVRSGPGTQYDIIGQLTSSNEVQITGRSDDESNWLRIGFEGREGWVAYFTVSVIGNTEQLPIVSPRNGQEITPVQATSIPANIQTSSDVFVTTYRIVNVRSGPGTQYLSIGSLQPGSSTDVTGRSGDYEWLRVRYLGMEGWVAYFVVSLTGSLENIPIVEAAPDAQTDEPPTTVAVVTRYNVNLRENPVLDSPTVDIIPFGTTLDVDARSDESDTWLRVEFEGQTGWIIRALVNASADFTNLPILRP
jgi:N-acetylmuramoyl-L-alanine amidase